MTKAQLKKLDAIIAKLEALQHEVEDRSGDLAAAKSKLFDAYRKAA